MILDLVETSPGSNVFFRRGNVFYNLGFPDAEELTNKMRFAVAVNRALKEFKLNRKQSAHLLGIDKAEMSALHGYEIRRFAVDRLMHFAAVLRYDATGMTSVVL
jgi:predicted XRE-type DNA-binding protein